MLRVDGVVEKIKSFAYFFLVQTVVLVISCASESQSLRFKIITFRMRLEHPVDLHVDRFGSRRRFRGLHNLLDELAGDFVARQEDVCLVPGHTTFQSNQVKHRKVAALWTQKHTVFPFVSGEYTSQSEVNI